MLLPSRKLGTLSALARRCAPLAAALALALLPSVAALGAAGQPEILPLNQEAVKKLSGSSGGRLKQELNGMGSLGC